MFHRNGLIMPYELSAREVLFYLNDLGYTNITAQQLKDFMIDLKKLLKYNDRCRSEEDSEVSQTDHFTGRDVFEELYNTDTIASRAKSLKARSKESVITVQINRPKSAPKQRVLVDEVVCSKETKSNSLPVTARASDPVASLVRGPSEQLSTAPSFIPEQQKCTTCSTASSTDTITTEKKMNVSEKRCKARPKTSFIRPRLNTKPPKSDPVALYHQYQEQWKRQKIPGTTNHPEVRWCIREKLMGDKFDYCY